jgi:hypothetical protein
LNLDKAKEELVKLNLSLQTKCRNLSLHLDYVYNHKQNSTLELYGLIDPYSLVLCLYNDNHCISSITIEIEDVEITIDSNTHKKYEGKKYNILLRCILIIISKLLSGNIERIISMAINPASAHILIKHFGGIRLNDIPEIAVELSDKNIENAKKKFDDILKGEIKIVC